MLCFELSYYWLEFLVPYFSVLSSEICLSIGSLYNENQQFIWHALGAAIPELHAIINNLTIEMGFSSPRK